MGTILPKRFEPIRVLRKGGASSSFVATDQQLGRNEVIVKVVGRDRVDPDTAHVMEVLGWYRGLHHPYFSEVLDAGLTERRDVFYVRNCHPDSELFTASGRDSLKALISAIDFLQSVGRVHGAIKPSNVFASAGRIKVTDPWIGELQDSNDLRSLEEDIRFSAPEVLDGHARSLESDLYSLGALLYRFFSGRDPFEASDPEFLKAKYIWAAPRPLLSVSHVSRKIADIVTHLLGKDPDGRRSAFESLKNELDVDRAPAARAPAIGLDATLKTALKHLQAKRGLRAVMIEGPIGSGKSRLVEELTSRISFEKQRAALCAVSSSEPLSDFARKVISLVEEHDIAAGSSSILRLQRFVEMESEPASKTAQEGINRDLVSLLCAVSRRVRLLLVLEDIDQSSRSLGPLLEELVRHGEDSQLWVLVTTRVAKAPSKIVQSLRDSLKESLHEVAMESLTSPEAKLLSSFLSSHGDHRSRAEQRAGGNPGFLEEFCKSSTPAVPKRVRQAISKMIADLPAETRRVAEILSLFDEPTTWNVLAAVSDTPEHLLKEAISHLESIGIVRGLSIRYPDAGSLIHSTITKAKRGELHARCFRFLQGSDNKESRLAHHAFQGGLFQIAGDLYRSLANKFFAEKDYISARRCFELATNCRSSGQSSALDVADSIKLAQCYSLQGKKGAAKVILKGFLDPKRTEGPESLSSVYAALASPLLEDSPKERVRLLRMAIDLYAEVSPKMVQRFAALCTALISLGDLEEAEDVLRRANTYGFSSEDLQPLETIRGFLLMNQGNFASAVQCFTCRPATWVLPGSISTNLAVCIEQLGDIRRAKEIQFAALQESSNGSLLIQLTALNNLAAMETKLGNTDLAEAYFQSVSDRLRSLRRQHEGARLTNFVPAFTDMATLAIHKGEYRNAASCLDSVDLESPGPFFPRELFHVAITRCDLQLEVGQPKLVLSTLNEARRLPIGGDFFDVECLLVEERLESPSKELCRRLEQAINSTERLGTVHQTCRIWIALASHLIALGDRSAAYAVAGRCKEICRANGYKPLLARAFLLLGRSTDRDEEMDFSLKAGLELAAEMGFAPLMVECTFHLGKLRLSRNDYNGAQDYLSKCISLMSRLADNLTGPARKAYLLKSQHREAKLLFDEALSKVALTSGVSDVQGKENSRLATLYRIASSVTAANDLSAAVGALLRALKDAMTHSIVIVVGSGQKATFHPIRGTVSEELRKRIVGIGVAACGKSYITGAGSSRRGGTVAWMPIPSFAATGGIYIETFPDGLFLDERDIEFLTVVAAISGSAFDQILGRTVVPGPAISTPRYGIVGSSKEMREVCARIEVAARNAAAVLIEGESGTGKELVARAIHDQSSRAKRPFVPVDCGALPEGLIEAELFGAKKGAYTGASTDRQGLFEAANQGTIFLDEISNLGIAAQAKLLRALQEKEIRKVGSLTGKAVDVRLIAATNCNLEALVRDGKFRHDLLYRLKVLHVLLPPLRNRKEDIPILATAFLEHLNSLNQTKKFFGPRVKEKFMNHNYPGNVRELHNAIERAFYTSSSAVITEVDFFLQSISVVASDRDSAIESWFKNLAEGRENFWLDVHDPYKRRDIPREKVIALMDFGLRTTSGSYKAMASMFRIPNHEYHRFMDFLRRSQCLLDFRPYRKRGVSDQLG